MDKIEYAGWKNCIRLHNAEIELIATTDVGPRIIRFGFIGGRNLLKEYPEQLGKTGGPEWRIYGGHRLWHAPEAAPRSYAADNEPVNYRWDANTLTLVQSLEKTTGIQKKIAITLDPERNHAQIVHRLINWNPWAVELAPWALTVMAPGGRAIIPQEPFRPHPDYLLPARPVVLWHYTDMNDHRWIWGTHYLQLHQEPGAPTKQKLGLLNKQGWAAYALGDNTFVKSYGFVEGARYPDYGCNTETFTDADMLELETLGPLTSLAPDGGSVEHVEQWQLLKAEVDADDAAIDRTLLPLLPKM